jgi:hypothetical protein
MTGLTLSGLTASTFLYANGTKQIASGSVSTPLDLTGGVLSLGTVPITKGGTGQTTKSAAFDALSPMSASGDIVYGGASGTGTRLAKGTDGQILTLTSGLPSWQDAPDSSFTASAPLDLTAGILSIDMANSSQSGYLSSTDWNNFNGKVSSLAGEDLDTVMGRGNTTSHDLLVSGTHDIGSIGTRWANIYGTSIVGNSFIADSGTTPSFILSKGGTPFSFQLDGTNQASIVASSGVGSIFRLSNIETFDFGSISTWKIPSGLSVSTVGSAGGASALPATPSGYIKFDIGGTTYEIPYYAN